MDPPEMKSEGCATLQKAEEEYICPSTIVRLYWDWSLASGIGRFLYDHTPADIERLKPHCADCPKYIPLED